MQTFEDRFVEFQHGANRVRARYWQAGEHGEPVMLLPGIGCSVLEWDKTMAPLAAKHRVFALDHLGGGASSAPEHERYSIQNLAQFVLGFAQALNLGPVHLAGFSLGGRVALECAIAQPSQVRSLLLAAPAGVGREAFFNFRLATLPFVGEGLIQPFRPALAQLWGMAYYDASKLEAERIDAKVADAKRPGAKAAFLKTLRGFLGFSGFHADQLGLLHQQVRRLKQPCTIVWGRQDKLLPCAQGQALQALMPQAQLHVLERCGHLPQQEQAAAFNALALELFAQKLA